MGMNENLHLFKEDILPMWEDERNKQGGKWTVCLDNKIMNVREMVDKLWMYLCFAMVSRLPIRATMPEKIRADCDAVQIGEDFEEKNDLICGAVISTRPRMFRFQIWIKEKDDIESVNAIGKNLVRILELENPTTGVRPPGISLDFSYHSKATPPVQKFLHIPMTPVPAPSSAFQALPGQVNGQPSRGLTPSGSTASISSLARPPGLGMVGNTFGGIGLSRAVSMNAIASKLASGNVPDQSATSGGTISWRERLGQTGRKSTLAAT
jgi:translation initiation factor 4E